MHMSPREGSVVSPLIQEDHQAIAISRTLIVSVNVRTSTRDTDSFPRE